MGKIQNGKGTIRCAIYTRKSSEEGLEQDFNSLDAQREACEAYVLSQKHEGWTALPAFYDDGGFSGGSMGRPALTRLLEDIEAGAIDTVVVYKVDRLTRALGDFAKIVEVFDRSSVSFVSVTQHFNTTSSMGRLTLNMLLSFAQFEREVTGERIRDKIAASKKKGMWMGGLAALGYDARDRSLVINQKEAETASHIYQRYLALGSVRALKEELDRDGVVTKQRADRYGRMTGGNPFSRGALYHMLQNRVYRGEIVHKGESYPGKHEALIDHDLWNRVQAQLATSRVDRSSGEGTKAPSLLAGLLYDDTGMRMTPSHANKNGARYRYYVSKGLITGNRRQTPAGRRMPAEDIERLVQERVCAFLKDEGTLFEALAPILADAHQRRNLITAAGELAEGWPVLEAPEKRRMLQLLVTRIQLTPDGLTIEVSTKAVADVLAQNAELPLGTLKPSTDQTAGLVMLRVSADLKRVGQGKRYVVDGKGLGIRGAPDRYLLKLLGQAHRYKAMVMRGQGKTISQLATEAGVGRSYFTRILRLAFLSPEIVRMILSGRHPRELTARRLAAETRLPIDWKEHRSMLGLTT